MSFLIKSTSSVPKRLKKDAFDAKEFDKAQREARKRLKRSKRLKKGQLRKDI
jgi:hypothetical protein